ncbi:hypothetical protein K437DRAFT_259912 [Tilletiaria anomala UBC 951]|uniref:Uncharacterized protein n=1 Tax=Tilletiaria anomala (strain ATCC 24038 / CBS 436.72 / UBC 951) TaxID=1037660 RepID=A0A066VA31_TILAU|nr:uncharacterized protein K437DRAFT_259912 [Tilletiaria anomala UBC 951]KDN37153.1 hypothetical protein K437DRAFT_259912 [Tilletiaria anomala UBC 951]
MPLPRSTLDEGGMEELTVLVINPNSSKLMTDSMLERAPYYPAVDFRFYTAPSDAPESINNVADEQLSADVVWNHLVEKDNPCLHTCDAILIACFSDHPLTSVLRRRERSPQGRARPVMNILEAAVIQSLTFGVSFGVITTTEDLVPDIEMGIASVLGSAKSSRYVGTRACGITAIQLKTLPKADITPKVQRVAQELVEDGAQVLVLGCSGMDDMTEKVQYAAIKAGMREKVYVVDSVKAGMNLLASTILQSLQAEGVPKVPRFA